jgi:iron complex outermembrane recepter protein
MRLHAGVAIACVLVAGRASSADSQTAGQQPAAEENSLGEIIVTARFRQENVQTVPITVTALGGGALEERGISDMIGLSSVVPNLQIRNTNAGPNQSDIRLRGVPDVAVYVDGIAHSNTAGQLMDVVDVDRIEVLNGPQGTLFGKNAIGGAIQYVTTRPSDKFSAGSKITFGSYGRVDATGTLNVPWNDVFFTKITGASLQHNGYVRDIGNNQYDGADRYTVGRFDSLFKPNDKFTARFIFAYTGETANQPPNVSTQNDLVCKGDPIPPYYTGKIPGPLCVLNTIGLKVDPTLNFGAQKLWEADSPASDGPEGYDYKSYDFTVDLGYALSDHWNIRSLTGYRDEWFSKLANHNGTPYVLISNTTGGITTELTQEFQLAYDGGWLKGTTGAYYYRDKFRRASISYTYTDLEAGTLAAQSKALGGRTPSFNQNEFDNIIEGYAGYTEWTAKLAERLSLTLGARYTTEKNETILYPPPVESLVCCTRLPTDLIPSGPQLVPTRDATFNNFTPRVSLQYQWTPDIMTYATYSKGFNAGGFNTATNVPIPYKPETLDNYELGLKSDLFDRHLRFNLSAFYGVYKDVQVKVNLPFGQTVVQATENAGEGLVRGLELETLFVPTDRLTLNLNVGVLKTAYTDTGGQTDLQKGTAFPWSPKLNYDLGAQYRISLGSDTLTLRGDYAYETSTESNIDPVFTVHQDGFGLLNARLTYQKAEAPWSVALFGTNLTDSYYLTNSLHITQEGWAFGEVAPPREWGITFTMKY